MRHKTRIFLLAILVMLLFSILLMRFFFLQVVEGERWQALAKRQHTLVIKEPFHRGSFISNASLKKSHPEKEVPFVIEVEYFHLHADPEAIGEEQQSTLARKVGEWLSLSSDGTRAVWTELGRRGRDRTLRSWLTREEKTRVEMEWRKFAKEKKLPANALFFVSDYRRSYPYGSLLGQVLHTTQERRDEASGQLIPTGGLELSLDRYLQGKAGRRLLLRSPRHALETGEVVEEPEDGADVYLTINHYLQTVVEEELARGMQTAGAKSGLAILMDPKTGEIWALAESPAFFPADYKSYFNNPELIESTKVKSITNATEPGSVMKPFTVLAALMANEELKREGKPPLFDPNEKISCSDGHFPGRKKPITEVRPYAFLDMTMGLQHSSNIYVARLAERIVKARGDRWYYETLKNSFGFGEKCGIELPGESAGLFPRPGKLHPSGALEWSVPTPFSLAMGYNMQLTSLQVIRAWALFANGGMLVKPHLVKRVQKGEDLVLEEEYPAVKCVSSALISKVVSAMRFDTMKGGTATRGNIPGYTEVGKSGTARKIVNGGYTNKKHLVSFVGFAPVDNPAFVLLVVLDEPEVRYIDGVYPNHHGGVSAAPIFREIGKRVLEYLEVPQDDPFGYAVEDPRYDPTKARFAKEAEELHEKYKAWNSK